MKRVLVTGANGFVCSNIVIALLEHGYFVYALDLKWDNPVIQTWSDKQVEFITSDCLSVPNLELDVLIHRAAMTADASELNLSAEDYFEAHLEPTLAMLRYAEDTVKGRSIFISSSAVYRKMDGITDENTLTNPLGLYAVAKQTMESLIDTLWTEYQRDVCCVRLGNIYGPHEYVRESRPRVSGIRQLIEMARTIGEITIYDNVPVREWTFAPDVGQAVVAILEQLSLTYSLYNIAQAKTFTWDAIAEVIAHTISGTHIQKLKTQEQPVTLNRRGLLNNTRLQEDIGFKQWTSLEEGIRLTIESLEAETHHA